MFFLQTLSDTKTNPEIRSHNVYFLLHQNVFLEQLILKYVRGGKEPELALSKHANSKLTCLIDANTWSSWTHISLHSCVCVAVRSTLRQSRNNQNFADLLASQIQIVPTSRSYRTVRPSESSSICIWPSSVWSNWQMFNFSFLFHTSHQNINSSNGERVECGEWMLPQAGQYMSLFYLYCVKVVWSD